jgi:hypothetical protein
MGSGKPNAELEDEHKTDPQYRIGIEGMKKRK